jgi:membrane-associated phospholipid phosphatase
MENIVDLLFELNTNIATTLQNLSPALDGLMKAVSFLGTVEFYLVFLPLIYWTIDRRIGIRALLLLLYTDFITTSLKLFFHQPRPYWVTEVRGISTESSYGIPSGHASGSLIIGGLFISNTKIKWIRVTLTTIILLIGISRIYLGVHFLHDVLAGWIIGGAILWVYFKWGKEIHAWIRSKSLGFQITLVFADSILVIIVGILIRFIVSGTPDPNAWTTLSIEGRTVTHFFTLGGALLGTGGGYALMRKYASFNTSGDWNKRGLRYLVGILGLLIIYAGLDILFSMLAADETTLGYILRYLRYALITGWATFLAPWIFIKTNLADIEKK